MNELRKDILLGRWIAVLSESLAPSEYKLPVERENTVRTCLLCSGHEKETPREIASIRQPGTQANTPGWWVRAIPSFKPVFQIEGDLGRKGFGIYDKMNSIGANEILIESPDHDKNPEDLGLEQMIRLITLYRNRIADLNNDPRMRYMLIYKNSGTGSGDIFSHPVSNLVATPVIPINVKDELDNAKQYFSYKERCIYCDIMQEELRTGDRVVFESRDFLCFCPYAAQLPFESWIIPKEHCCAFHEISQDAIEDMGFILMTVLKKLKTLFPGVPFNYYIHTAPNMVPRKNHWHTLGEDYHWHLEIIPRLVRMSGFEWGSGLFILPTSPEDAAKYLREVG
jgi:UDPglucose--hexose-1-phosphate uridylyltransferase